MAKRELEISTQTDWRSLYVLAVIAFLGALKIGTAHTLWPYMRALDASINESFYGYVLSTASIANLLASFLTGYVSNLIAHTKPSIIIGKALTLAGAIAFLSAEIAPDRHFVFVAMEVLFGFGMGLLSVGRTYVAMSSSEKDRPRAISLISISMALGVALGPIVMGLLTLLKYPGYELIGGLHFNVYSAPVYIFILTLIVSIGLLIALFDGKMRLLKVPDESEETQTGKTKKIFIDPTTLPKHQRYDKIAVITCCATKFLATLSLVFNQSLSSVYMMTAFQWRGEELVRYSSIMHACIGIFGIGWSIAYFSGAMAKLVSERRAVLYAMILKLTFFIITYPYSFYSNTIAYEVLAVNETTGKTSILESGCKLSYEWCAYTPRINPYVYVIAKVVLIGLAGPLMHLSLDILYSKVLGQIRQGTLQAIFIISGDVLQVIGPVFLTQLYQKSGPRYIWLLIISVNAAVLALWIINYRRLVPSSRRIQAMVDNFEIVQTPPSSQKIAPLQQKQSTTLPPDATRASQAA